jgi:Ca2+-transporting ATPase
LFSSVPLAVLPAQILWINIINDGFPNFSLAFEKSDNEVMENKPNRREEPILDKESKVIIFDIAILRDIVIGSLFLWMYHNAVGLGLQLDYIRTIFFAILSFDAIVSIFSLRSLSLPIWKIKHLNNPYLLLAVFLSLGLLALAVYFPPLQRMLSVVPLSPQAWLLIGGVSAINICLVEMVKGIFIFGNRKHQRPVVID